MTSSASGISSTHAWTISPSSWRRASRPIDSATTRMACSGSMKQRGISLKAPLGRTSFQSQGRCPTLRESWDFRVLRDRLSGRAGRLGSLEACDQVVELQLFETLADGVEL